MRRKIAAAAVIFLAATHGCKENRWVPRGRADLILSEIKLRGPESVSRRIDTDEDFGRTVMDGIASGDSVWLEVAGALRPASASAEASMSIALASALPRAPQRVLRLLGNKYPVEEVCGIPFLKADSSQVIAYHNDVTRALTGVAVSPQTAVSASPSTDTPASSLSSVLTSCRTALDSSRSRRLERINPAYVIKNKPAPARRRSRR